MLPGLDPPPGWIRLDWTGEAKALDGVPRGRGSFLLLSADGRPVQLGAVDHLAARLRYYLTRPPPKKASRRRADLTADTARIWYRPAGSRFESELDCLEVARAAWPADYRERLELRPAAFLSADFSEPFPRILAGEHVPDDPRAIGPFPGRAAAGRYAERLEQIFELCRCRQSRSGPIDSSACVLRQMGRCTLPADVPAGAAEYGRRVSAALAFAGRCDEIVGRLTAEMTAAAAGTRFEEAGRLKARLSLAQQVRGPKYRWVGAVGDFRLVLVEPAAEPGQWVGFGVVSGRVERTEPFTAATAGERVSTLAKSTQTIYYKSVMANVPARVREDQWGLVLRHLGRERSGPLSAWRVDGQTDPGAVIRMWEETVKKSP
jgi:hypothetical protein